VASDEVVVFCLVLLMREMFFSVLRIADARSVWRTVLCRPSQVNVMSACVLMMDSKVHIYQEIPGPQSLKDFVVANFPSMFDEPHTWQQR